MYQRSIKLSVWCAQALATGNLDQAPPEFRDVLVPLHVRFLLPAGCSVAAIWDCITLCCRAGTLWCDCSQQAANAAFTAVLDHCIIRQTGRLLAAVSLNQEPILHPTACMQVDIQDKDTEIVIKADTPGLTGADLTVRLPSVVGNVPKTEPGACCGRPSRAAAAASVHYLDNSGILCRSIKKAVSALMTCISSHEYYQSNVKLTINNLHQATFCQMVQVMHELVVRLPSRAARHLVKCHAIHNPMWH
jgi:hypothetical protein